MEELKRTFDILSFYENDTYQKDDAIAGKQNGEWVKYSNQDYVKISKYVSLGLLAMGLEKGDRVAVITNNRPEWNFVDMGTAQAGIINVPIHATFGTEEMEYILKHSQPSILILADDALYKKVGEFARSISSIKEIYTFDEVNGCNNWKEVIQAGKDNEEEQSKNFEEIKAKIVTEDVLTIIYTSGTTGNPKGVMLSHLNIMTNVSGIRRVFDFGPEDKTLSFLPVSHIFERTCNYFYQYNGLSTYYAESLSTIADNLKEVKPSIFITVPRVLERVYDRIIGKGNNLKGIKKNIFFWAVNLGLKFKVPNGNGWFYMRQLKIARKLVFSKWQEALGGKIKVVVSGGAALQPRLARVFNAAGIPLVEGYGLTETSPVISVNNNKTREVMVGTVGPLLAGVEVKIADDGEILCKGDSVMKGYYNAPELTNEVIDSDGWFHTGDAGELIDGKYLKITDRKKEMFKLSNGKYIAPQAIENKFKESLLIEQIMVIGENQKFASAILSPHFNYLHNWASENKISFRTNKELISIKEVVSLYQKEVQELNKQLGSNDQIKRFQLTEDEWSTPTGELSPTLKLKRKFLHEKYAEIIDQIYSSGNKADKPKSSKINIDSIKRNMQGLVNKLSGD